MRRLLLLVLVYAVSIAPSVAHAQLVFDNGLQNVLTSLDPAFDPATTPIEIRDSTAGDPTGLDVDLPTDPLDPIRFMVHGDSSLALTSLGYAVVQTFDDSDATIENGSAIFPGDNAGFTAWDRSELNINEDVAGGSARGNSTVTFGTSFGVLSTFYQGMDDSNTIMLGGAITATRLSGNATMTVIGGEVGFDSVELTDSARLVVDGGTILGALGIEVDGSAVAELRSGNLRFFDTLFSRVRVSQMGLVQLFGTDFMLDGAPIGPGEITAPAGGTTFGVLSGIFESGQPFSFPFGVSDRGRIQLVPEPTTGALLGLAFLLAAQVSGKGSAKA